MGYVEKTRTWDDNWNNVIRTIIFQDSILKEQMLVPCKTPINQFIDKYFIENASVDELLTTENVRILYYDNQGRETGNKNIRLKYKEFDIYVKQNILYTATPDRLKSRTALIAERLKYLLLNKYHICGQHFRYEDEYDLWTKTVGYKRYHIVFSYRISV